MKRVISLAAMAVLAIACTTGNNSQYPNPDYSWEKDLAHRYAVDFNKTRQDVKDYISRLMPDVTDEAIDAWTEAGILESRMIDGELMYFDRTAPNLFRVVPEAKILKRAAMTPEDKADEAFEDAFNTEIYRTVMAGAPSANAPASHSQRMRVKYTLTVDADAVPDGTVLRCWLPLPREDVSRQADFRFIGSYPENGVYSAPEFKHRTLYLEQKAKAGEPTVFNEMFEYTFIAEDFKLDAGKVEAAAKTATGKDAFASTADYYKATAEYTEMTSEREAHVIFTDRLKSLADELTAGLVNPYDKAKAIFTWISDNFPWAGAREYSTIENIPEYVLDVRHGDCGQQSLLFITLCRICGIPAHFQSGFNMKPHGFWNLHDWAEVYFEGIGWVPVDQSNGINYDAEDEAGRYFFLGGTDCYRMIVNQDYGMPLDPMKIYPRSETVDFQRGEVESELGNLYFDLWDYHMDIEYL